MLSSRECSARPFCPGDGQRGLPVSTLDSSKSAAGEELLFLPLSFSAPVEVEGCRPKAPSVGSTTHCLGMATGKNVRVASCG